MPVGVRSTVDDDLGEDLAILERLEALPQRATTPTERTHKRRRKQGLEAKADEYNELVARYGRPVGDLMVKHGWFAVLRAVALIRAECEQWFRATGARVDYLRPAEHLGLQCYLWETFERQRQEHRWKPKKSPEHDAPWPGAPAKWATRRWFRHDILKALRKLFPGLPRHPLQISVSRALNRERAKARAEFATEIKGEGNAPWETEPLAERNHPKPQGFWSVKRNALTDTLVWSDCRWEPCEDEAPPQSVLDQTHEPPEVDLEALPGDWNLQRRLDLFDRWQEATGKTDAERKRLSEAPKKRNPPHPLADPVRSGRPIWPAPAVIREACPGAWSQRHVEARANDLAARGEECRRRREAAIDGLLSNAAVAA